MPIQIGILLGGGDYDSYLSLLYREISSLIYRSLEWWINIDSKIHMRCEINHILMNGMQETKLGGMQVKTHVFYGYWSI